MDGGEGGKSVESSQAELGGGHRISFYRYTHLHTPTHVFYAHKRMGGPFTINAVHQNKCK